MPFGLLGIAVDHGQAQAGALADGLGGEEGIEGARHDLGRHPGAVVGDQQRHVVTGTHRIQAIATLGKVDITRFDADGPAVGQGIASVDDQVEQGALQLVPVRQGLPEILVQIEHQDDVTAQTAQQQLLHGPDAIVHVNGLQIERLAPGEGEQALGESCRALGGAQRRV